MELAAPSGDDVSVRVEEVDAVVARRDDPAVEDLDVVGREPVRTEHLGVLVVRGEMSDVPAFGRVDLDHARRVVRDVDAPAGGVDGDAVGRCEPARSVLADPTDELSG